jgi:hypothetical protein
VALEMAFCLAIGLPYFGHGVERVPVIYVSGEGGSGLQLRLRALEIARQAEAPEDGLKFLPDAVQFPRDCPLRSAPPAGFDVLCETSRGRPPGTAFSGVLPR